MCTFASAFFGRPRGPAAPRARQRALCGADDLAAQSDLGARELLRGPSGRVVRINEAALRSALFSRALHVLLDIAWRSAPIMRPVV